MSIALNYLLVFVAMVATDFIWGKYTSEVSKENAHASGLWAVGIIVVGSYVTRAYVADWTAIIPAAAGAFVGTYLSVRHSKG